MGYGVLKILLFFILFVYLLTKAPEKIMALDETRWTHIGLYTGTRLYRYTGLVALTSEPVFPLLSIQYSF